MSHRLTLASILMASGLLALILPVFPAAFVSRAETISSVELAVNLPRDLKLSSIGEDVRELQKFLNKAGLVVSTSGPGSPGNETTFFGEATSKAVVRYQERHAEDLGLTKGTGFVGPLTRALINKTTLIISTVSIPVSADSSVIFAEDLQFGSNNNDVKKLQNALINENLLGSTSATGYFGPLTLRAVVAYQGRHSLPMTGFVGPLTRAKLNESMVVRDTQTSGIAQQTEQSGVSQSNDSLVYLPAQTSTAPAITVTVGNDAGAGSASNSSSASVSSGSSNPSPSSVSTPAPAPAAIHVLDTQAPTAPTNLSAAAISQTQIDVSWTASTDAVGVTGYRVYRGGLLLASGGATTYSDTGLTASTAYSYAVSAVDAAGNISPQSSSVSATTQSPPPPVSVAPTSSSAPIVLYTDLLSGPISGGENGKGVYLSIFGRNFGSSGLGTAVKVYIGGVEVDNYRYLGPSKVYGALGIQQITVQVGALGNPTLGTPLPIKVVVGGLSSNTDKTFTANPGNIYFVSLSGDDSTGAANDITRPYRYVQKSGINNNNYNLSSCPISAGDQAVSAAGVWGIIHPGDVIVMRGGVWTDVSAANSFLSVQNKSGTAPAGTSGTGPITVMGYPGEDVFINNVYTPGTYGAGIRSADSVRQAIGCGAWMTFANLRVESGREEGVFNTEKGDANPSGSHWRVVNNEMTSYTAVNNPDAKGAGVSGGGAGNYWVGNYVHDIYDKSDGKTDLENHGFYVQGDGPYEIAYNQIKNIYGGNGINVYNPYGTSSYVNFHDNVINGVAKHGLNIVNGAASGMIFYNNVVYNTDYYCLRLSSLNFSGAKIYNNTFYNCDIKGGGYNGAIVNDWQPLTSSMVTLRNNIVSPYPGRRYVSGVFGAGMFSNNLYYNGTDGLPTSEPGQIVGNPSFVSAGTNFQLSAGSPAIDAGSSAVSSVVMTDILSTSRPQGAGYDIGAYEKE